VIFLLVRILIPEGYMQQVYSQHLKGLTYIIPAVKAECAAANNCCSGQSHFLS